MLKSAPCEAVPSTRRRLADSSRSTNRKSSNDHNHHHHPEDGATLILFWKNGKVYYRAASQLLGVKELEITLVESKVYPNPADGFAVIEANDLMFNDKCEVKLNDILGREVGVIEMKEGKARARSQW